MKTALLVFVSVWSAAASAAGFREELSKSEALVRVTVSSAEGPALTATVVRRFRGELSAGQAVTIAVPADFAARQERASQTNILFYRPMPQPGAEVVLLLSRQKTGWSLRRVLSASDDFFARHERIAAAKRSEAAAILADAISTALFTRDHPDRLLLSVLLEDWKQVASPAVLRDDAVAAVFTRHSARALEAAAADPNPSLETYWFFSFLSRPERQRAVKMLLEKLEEEENEHEEDTTARAKQAVVKVDEGTLPAWVQAIIVQDVAFQRDPVGHSRRMSWSSVKGRAVAFLK
jgi:hypothetical protein